MSEQRPNEQCATPGPWCVMGRESATAGWKDLSVCQETMPFNRVCFLTSDGPAEANGRLIAAAPDLLQALKDLVETFEGGPSADEGIERLEAAERAIAKAEST